MPVILYLYSGIEKLFHLRYNPSIFTTWTEFLFRIKSVKKAHLLIMLSLWKKPATAMRCLSGFEHIRTKAAFGPFFYNRLRNFWLSNQKQKKSLGSDEFLNSQYTLYLLTELLKLGDVEYHFSAPHLCRGQAHIRGPRCIKQYQPRFLTAEERERSYLKGRNSMNWS